MEHKAAEYLQNVSNISLNLHLILSSNTYVWSLQSCEEALEHLINLHLISHLRSHKVVKVTYSFIQSLDDKVQL
uniref:Uncharacterized protein n=1 Tax=Rhizophora mucronata TaxID=61149 RepID=A0A2P2QCA0_RHIMU